MKLTRERKVYLMLLVLGGGVLGMDQLMGGPSTASASHSAADVQQAIAAASPIAPARTTRVPLHQRLLELDRDSGPSLGVQIFDIDARWRAELAPPEVTGTNQTVPAGVGSTSVALPRVSMVVQDAKGGYAMMDGKPIRVGETTASGAVLVSVESGSVTVELSGVLHTIVVAR